MEEKKQWERYYAACHAVQSGVAMMMNYAPSDTTPKHLRVGINMTKVDQAGLVRLLISKGLFTELEYLTAIADEAERERDRYVAEIVRATGAQPGSIHLA